MKRKSREFNPRREQLVNRVVGHFKTHFRDYDVVVTYSLSSRSESENERIPGVRFPLVSRRGCARTRDVDPSIDRLIRCKFGRSLGLQWVRKIGYSTITGVRG